MRPRAEREFCTTRRPEEVGDQRKGGAGNVGEQERRTAGGNHPAVDLGCLEVRVDLGVDDGKVAITR